MGKRMDYYAYLSEHMIQRLDAQTPRNVLARLAFELQLDLPFLKLKATTSDGKQAALAAQAQAIVAHVQRHEPQHIGTVDDPKRSIMGTLPMFYAFLPQGFGEEALGPPELAYFGGSTQKTIVGLAGGAHYVFASTDGELTGSGLSPPQAAGL